MELKSRTVICLYLSTVNLKVTAGHIELEASVFDRVQVVEHVFGD